jgi:sucrose-6-phosphate hydrolase SacC (GH32 family)
MIGEFDGKKFKPDTKEIQFHYGNCFYASQTFSNISESDGRRIQMAWGVIPTWGMPFNMILLFPVELTLRTTGEGIRLFAYPVKEIENIYSKEYTWSDFKLEPGQNILSGIEGELLDIDAEFEVTEAESFGFVFNGLPVSYNMKKNLLSCGEEEAELKPVDGKIRLRILVDRVSVEIFANNGRLYMPIRAYIKDEERGLTVFTKGGDTKISSLKVYQLKSIWD